MLKKLQNLLFEDEEEEILEDEEDTTETPVVTRPAVVSQPEPAPVRKEPEPAPVREQERTTMQRIDVTQPVPIEQTRPQAPKSESVFSQPAARPVQESRSSAAPGKIKVDPKPEPKKQEAPKPAKPSKPAKKERPERPVYQFQPVISPIFGVDEKDMNALKTTTSKITEKEKAKIDKNISPIISPMYGTDAEESPLSIHKTVEKTDYAESTFGSAENAAAEDEIPEFSLDDILKVRDEEYADEQKTAAEGLEPLFPDLTFDEDEVDTGELKNALLPDLFGDEE